MVTRALRRAESGFSVSGKIATHTVWGVTGTILASITDDTPEAKLIGDLVFVVDPKTLPSDREAEVKDNMSLNLIDGNLLTDFVECDPTQLFFRVSKDDLNIENFHVYKRTGELEKLLSGDSDESSDEGDLPT